MIAYVNPRFGNDATAKLNSRSFPWKTHEPAEAALRDAWKQAMTDDPRCTEPFRMVETHKPLPAEPDA